MLFFAKLERWLTGYVAGVEIDLLFAKLPKDSIGGLDILDDSVLHGVDQASVQVYF